MNPKNDFWRDRPAHRISVSGCGHEVVVPDQSRYHGICWCGVASSCRAKSRVAVEIDTFEIGEMELAHGALLENIQSRLTFRPSRTASSPSGDCAVETTIEQPKCIEVLLAIIIYRRVAILA